MPEVELRTQDSRPRLKTPKKSEAKANTALPRPRTQAQVFSEIEKGLQNFFQAISKKKGLENFFSGVFQSLQKIFQPICKFSAIQKIVLSSSRGQGNCRGLEASRPRPKTSKCVLEDSTSGDCSPSQ